MGHQEGSANQCQLFGGGAMNRYRISLASGSMEVLASTVLEATEEAMRILMRRDGLHYGQALSTIVGVVLTGWDEERCTCDDHQAQATDAEVTEVLHARYTWMGGGE